MMVSLLVGKMGPGRGSCESHYGPTFGSYRRTVTRGVQFGEIATNCHNELWRRPKRRWYVDPRRLKSPVQRRNPHPRFQLFFSTSTIVLDDARTREHTQSQPRWPRPSQHMHPSFLRGNSPAAHPVCRRLSLSSTRLRPIMALTQATVMNLTLMTSMTHIYAGEVITIAGTL